MADEGETRAAVLGRPPRLTHEELRRAQTQTLAIIIEELIARSGRRQPQIKFFSLPQAIAFVYYQVFWLLFVVRPSWSYHLNADCGDHAEHEYMTMVAEHPGWESAPFGSSFADDFGPISFSRGRVSGRSATTSGCTSTGVRP